MAVLDFGLNRFTVTVSGTTVSNHAPISPDGGRVGSVAETPVIPTTPDLARGLAITTISNASVSTGQHAPVRMSIGSFGFGGRLYTSDYVTPTPVWTPRVTFIR